MRINIYLAGGISDDDRKQGQKKMAKRIRSLGYNDLYAASENDAINDKSNNPNPIDIYHGDIDRIKECDIFIVRISGAGEDGTISEIGAVAGWNEGMEELNRQLEEVAKQLDDPMWLENKRSTIKILAYVTNERMLEPQFWHGIASAGYNHLVAGMIDRWGGLIGTREDIIKLLQDRQAMEKIILRGEI